MSAEADRLARSSTVCRLTLRQVRREVHLREQALPSALSSVSFMPCAYLEEDLAMSFHSCLQPEFLPVLLAGGSLPA